MNSFWKNNFYTIDIYFSTKWIVLQWKSFSTIQCMPTQGGGPCDETLKKIEKSRSCKSYDTLTTIQLGEKTQLTKVVSPLKRFGGPLQTRWDNRKNWLKKQLSGGPPDGWPPESCFYLFFEPKIAIISASL